MSDTLSHRVNGSLYYLKRADVDDFDAYHVDLHGREVGYAQVLNGRLTVRYPDETGAVVLHEVVGGGNRFRKSERLEWVANFMKQVDATHAEVLRVEADMERAAQTPGFDMKCRKCGSETVKVVNTAWAGTDVTAGEDGVDLECNDCGQRVTVV